MQLSDIAAGKDAYTIQQLGEKTELVREIQSRLSGLSYYLGNIDGIYGRQTDQANTRFCIQSYLNCPQTGLYGATWARKLLEAKAGGKLITEAQAEYIFGTDVYPNELQDLNDCLKRYEINTIDRICHFMAQIAHESGGLKWLKELDQGWYIPDNFGYPAIAGADGGYKYRGAGAIQLSLPENYQRFAEYMGDPEIYKQGCPYVAEKYPFTSAGFWWKDNGLNKLIDEGATVRQVSCMVNRGHPNCNQLNGLEDRQYYYSRAVYILGAK